MYEGVVQDLIDELGRLPGVGPKSAQRLAFYVMRLPDEEARNFAEAITAIRGSIHFCGQCCNYADGDVCEQCLGRHFAQCTINACKGGSRAASLAVTIASRTQSRSSFSTRSSVFGGTKRS